MTLKDPEWKSQHWDTHHEKPRRGIESDGIYPRCVWCDGENYALAVLAYSAGEHPCAAVGGCGRYLPEDYVLRTPRTDDVKPT